MLIPLLEKYPIITVDEARMLGQMKGAILQNNRLVAILSFFESEDAVYPYTCRNTINKSIEIPIEHLVIGPDAFIITKSSVANIHFPHGQAIQSGMCIYTCAGEFVGQITGIELSTDYTLQGIHIECGYIESSRIIKIGDVIIVDSDAVKKDLDTASETSSEDSVVFLKVMQEENNEDTTNQLSIEEKNTQIHIEETSDLESENPILSAKDSNEKLSDITTESETATEVVYSRYSYLLDKKLINPITIADKIYPDDSIINTELLEEAIHNNCILSLIMNVED